MRNRSRKINRSEVTDKRTGSASGLSREKKRAGSEKLQNTVREKHSLSELRILLLTHTWIKRLNEENVFNKKKLLLKSPKIQKYGATG